MITVPIVRGETVMRQRFVSRAEITGIIQAARRRRS